MAKIYQGPENLKIGGFYKIKAYFNQTLDCDVVLKLESWDSTYSFKTIKAIKTGPGFECFKNKENYCLHPRDWSCNKVVVVELAEKSLGEALYG